MSFWEKLRKHFETKQQEDGPFMLHQKIIELLPQESEIDHLKIACISGLLARVAYCDQHIHHDELDRMKKVLAGWTALPKSKIEAISTVALDEIQELAGLDNHIYAHELSNIMNEKEKYSILELLFEVAASDGSTENIESEEIRTICKGLGLRNQHFLSARAKVVSSLKSLKN